MMGAIKSEYLGEFVGIRSRHCVVLEETANNLPEPFRLFADGLMHAPPKLLRSSSLITVSFAWTRSRRLFLWIRNLPWRDLPLDEGEAQEVEGLRLAKTPPFAVGRRMAAERDQAGLVRVERQRKLLEPCAHRIEEPTGVGLVLEAGNNVIGIPDDDHVASGLAPSPAFGPEVEDIVQVDVGQKR